MLFGRRKMFPLTTRRPRARFFLDYDFDERAMVGWCGPYDETEK
jgi:hypothetical protein